MLLLIMSVNLVHSVHRRLDMVCGCYQWILMLLILMSRVVAFVLVELLWVVSVGLRRAAQDRPPQDCIAHRGVEEMSGPEGGSSRVLPNTRHGELKEAKGRRGGHGEAQAGERGPESAAGTGKGRQSARFRGVDHIRACPGRELPRRSFSMPPNSELSPFINLV